MTNQPSVIQHRKRGRRKMTRLTDGTYVGSDRGGGDIVVVTWGTDIAEDGAYDELLADLVAEGDTFTLTFEDPNGNAASVNVVAEEIDRKYGPANVYSAFTVTFWETS